MLSDPIICRNCNEPFVRARRGLRYCAPCQTCAVAGCEKSRGKGSYCLMHYDRLITTGKLGGALSTVVENGGPCAVSGCESIATIAGLCESHYRRRRKRPGDFERLRLRVGLGVDAKGYAVFTAKGKHYKMHRVVMENMIGRPLRKNETVHHIDGDRLNNSPENLELWASIHPTGQRASDRVRSAVSLLKEYPDLLAREGFKLLALESQESSDLSGDFEFTRPAASSPAVI
jgi:HNH endonuclease